MFDHYYEVTKDNILFQDYFDWRDDLEEMRSGIKAFKKAHDIAGDTFMYSGGMLWINRSLNPQLVNQMCKNERQGHSALKKNSKLGKLFTAANIKCAHRPFLPFYFKDVVGRTQTRLFDYEGKVYAQLSTETEIEDLPRGFIPMKASEFYKIIETLEEE